MALAFSSTGSVPKVVGVLSPNNPYGTGTSAAVPFPMSVAPKMSMIPQQTAPTTAVKSVSTPQGTTTYHAPIVKAPDDPSNKYNTATGQLNPKYKDPNAPTIGSNPGMIPTPSYTPPTPVATPTGPYVPPNQGSAGISQGGLISNAVTQSQGPSQAYLDAQAEANRVAEERKKLENEFLQKSQNIEGTAGFLTQATGLQGQLQNKYNVGQAALSGQEASAASRLAAANTQQGLQQSALSTAIGANAPVTQFGQLTSPTTGGVIGADATGNNPLYTKALQTAISMFNSGTPQSDAIAASGLSNFGSKGITEFSNMIGGGQSGYNPTADTASKSASITFGAQAQTQAAQLKLGLDQLNKIATPAIDFFSKALINPTDSTVWNGTIREYTDKFGNTGAAMQANQIINDINKFQAQIIASNNAGTPTGVSEAQARIDPQYLSARELKDYLTTLETLGKMQYDTLIKNSLQNPSYLSPNITRVPAPTNIPVSAPNKATTAGQLAQVARGGIMSLAPSAVQAGVQGAGAAGGFTLMKSVIAPLLKWIGL